MGTKDPVLDAFEDRRNVDGDSWKDDEEFEVTGSRESSPFVRSVDDFAATCRNQSSRLRPCAFAFAVSASTCRSGMSIVIVVMAFLSLHRQTTGAGAILQVSGAALIPD
jgi:hypothetical protein